MFEAEAKGLLLLAATEEIHIPQVVLTRTGQEFQFIVLEFIQQNGKAKSFWQDMGRQLAAVHRHTQEDFGLDYDNFIGALPQRNAQRKNWVDFFVENRLQVQLELACTRRIAATADLQQFEKLFKKLPDLFPAEAPALLHGDLWSGNLIADETGMPCLVDPAVYFGNREAELAFTRLFGGFSHDFYDSYRAAFPLIPGFEERVDLYNLYPLLVHTNLFGGNYWAEVRQILNRYA